MHVLEPDRRIYFFWGRLPNNTVCHFLPPPFAIIKKTPGLVAASPVPGVQIVGKGAKNRATTQRAASEKDAGKLEQARL